MHTDSPETSVAVVADDQPSTSLRRRLLGAGLLGLAGTLVPRLSTSASASTPTDTTDDTDDTTDGSGATTTTAAPKRPDGDDAELLSFAQSVELAIAELYEMAMTSGAFGEPLFSVLSAVHQSHVSFGQGLNALLGRDAPGEASAAVLEEFSEAFGGDEDQVIAAAYQLEDAAVATHSELIGQLVGTNGAELIAAMLIAEARHSLVFADLAGETDLDTLIFTAAEALQPEEG